MLDVTDPETFWLNFTNIGLGLVTLGCVLVVAFGVMRELLAPRARTAAHDDVHHVFTAPELGPTMADGGVPAHEPPPKRSL